MHDTVGTANGRTNTKGMAVLSDVFGVDVLAVPVPYHMHILHLKSLMTWIDGHTVVTWDHDCAKQALKHMNESIQNMNSSLPKIEALFVPDLAIANVVRVNDTVFISEGFPESEAVIERAMHNKNIDPNLRIVAVDNSELRKCDSALSCLSVLLSV